MSHATLVFEDAPPADQALSRRGQLTFALAIAAVLAADVLTPVGVGVSFLYVPILWAMLLCASRRQVLAAAAVCTLLTMLTPEVISGGDFQTDIINRTIVLIALWFLVYFGSAYRRMVDTLQSREKELADFIENAAVGMHWLAPDGTILWANSEQLEMLGYTRDEFIGRCIAEFHVDKGLIGEVMGKLNAGAALGDHVARYRCKSGSVRDLLVSSSFQRKRDAIVQVRCFTRDVTDRRRAEQAEQKSDDLAAINDRLQAEIVARRQVQLALEEAERQYRQLVESVPAIVWRADARTFQFSFVSRQAETILGYPLRRWLDEPRFWPDHLHPEDREAAVAYCLKATSELRAHDFEYRMIAADGHTVWLRDLVRVEADRGEARELVGVMVDITEQKHAEARIRDNEELLRVTFDAAPIGVNMVDLEGRFMRANRAYQELVGYSEGELRGMQTFDLNHPQDTPRNRVLREELLEGKRNVFEIEKRYLTKDGRCLWVRNRVSLVKDALGKPKFTVAAVQDINERKHTEEALRESEARYRTLIENSPYCIHELDLQGRLISMNRAGLKMMSVEHATEICGLNYLQTVMEDDRARVWALFERAVEGESSEFEFTAYNGRSFQSSFVPIQDPHCAMQRIMGLTQDITERKKAGQELERKTALAQLLEALARAVNEATTPGEAMQVCLERICEHGNWVLGRLGMYAPGEGGFVPRLSAWHEKHPGRYAKFQAASMDDRNFSHAGLFLTAVLRENKPVWLDDIPARAGAGRHRIAAACGLGSAFAFPVSVRGNVVAFLEFYAEELRPADPLLMDASTSVGAMLARLIERSQAAAEREQLAAIVESSAEAIWSRAADHTLLSWNAAAERLFGWTRDEVVSQRENFLVPPERLHERQLIPDRLARGEDTVTFETSRLRKDGTPIDVELRASAVRDESGNVIWTAFIAHDITQRKAAETALRDYSKRLHVLSRRLIDAQERERSVIARELHDQTGQVLSVLKLTLQIARRDARARQVAPHLDEALQHIDTALQQVRTLSYSLRPPQLDDLGLVAALRNYADRIAGAARLTVHYDIQAPPQLAGQSAIACFRVAQEAITNVARHAAAHNLWIALACDDELRLEVRDDGKGCDILEVRRRALRGDSMGVVNMEERTLLGGGRIDIDSSPGNGTVVRATFPFSVAQPAPAAEGTT